MTKSSRKDSRATWSLQLAAACLDAEDQGQQMSLNLYRDLLSTELHREAAGRHKDEQ